MTCKCPMCQSVMVERVDFFLCADCGCEVWPNADEGANDIEAVWKDEQHYKHSISAHGGGSKNGVKQEKKGTKVFVSDWESMNRADIKQ